MENLITRVKQFILQPKVAWEEVSSDMSDARTHITGYVLPLALIPAVATFIGLSIIGYSFLGTHVRLPIASGIGQAIVSYVGIVLGVIISAIVIQKLAPKYDASISVDKAIKLVGYSYTAMMIGGIFNILPSLSIIALLASIYSLYTLYLGFKPMTNVPESKASNYFWVSLVVIILVYIVIFVVLGAIMATMGLGSMAAFG